MARILEINGIASRKVFIVGDLQAASREAPNGTVHWIYHVAPVISVRMPDDRIQEMVLDPSLMSAPVSYPTWEARMTPDLCPVASSGFHDDLSDCYRFFTDRHAYRPEEPDKSSWSSGDLDHAVSTMKRFLKAQRSRGF